MVDIDKIYSSNSYGDYKVIEDIGALNDKNGISRHYIKIKFLLTGFEKVVRIEVLDNGKVKDPYFPSIYGIGCIGEFYNIRQNVTLYKTWHSIISRCYNAQSKDYNAYGGIGVRVCERWHCFANFFYDVQLLPNYNLKMNNPDLYQLDKDYMQRNVPKQNRVYSPTTCIWLSVYDNVAMRTIDNNNTKYYGVHPNQNGKTYKVFFQGRHLGTFNDEIVAANVFNNAYMRYNNGTNGDISLINDVPYIHPGEFIKYNVRPKQMCHTANKNN